ncbi:MAG TPA: hypothetical protein VKQ72_06305, partial [Aggregatilineales bacterium]|nr:hypothetical protein [Aggregatilineales bacterium]
KIVNPWGIYQCSVAAKLFFHTLRLSMKENLLQTAYGNIEPQCSISNLFLSSQIRRDVGKRWRC